MICIFCHTYFTIKRFYNSVNSQTYQYFINDKEINVHEQFFWFLWMAFWKIGEFCQNLLKNLPLRKFLQQNDYLSELSPTLDGYNFFFSKAWVLPKLILYYQKYIRSKDFACRYFFRLNIRMHGCPSEIQSHNIVHTCHM